MMHIEYVVIVCTHGPDLNSISCVTVLCASVGVLDIRCSLLKVNGEMYL